MIFETPPTPSPVPGLLLVLSIAGAVADWRYKRNGGKRSTRRDRMLYLIALLLVASLLAVLWQIGGPQEAGIIGSIIPSLAILLFAAWEMGRWRVRRKNPLSSSQQPFVVPIATASKQFCSQCGRVREPSEIFCTACGRHL